MKAKIVFEDGTEIEGHAIKHVLHVNQRITPSGILVEHDIVAEVQVVVTNYADIDWEGTRFERRIDIR